MRRNIFSIVFYILLFTVFCALFEQAGSSLMLFFEKAVFPGQIKRAANADDQGADDGEDG